MMGKTKNLLEEFTEEIQGVYKELFQPSEVKETKVVEFNVGRYKTTVTYKFDKNGYPIHNSHKTETSEKGLKIAVLEDQLGAAIHEKNFMLAAEIQRKIDELK